MMKGMNAHPRVLADDSMVSISGADSLERFKHISEATIKYCEDLGARVAPDKSFTFSSDKKVKANLKQHIWKSINKKLKVLSHTRDLGTHLSLNAAMVGTTINERIDETIATIQKIARMPFGIKIKATLIRMSGFPKALYGIEAAPCTEAKLDKLRTAIVDTIGPNSTLRSPEMVFLAATDGDDLDPIAQVASLRLTAMRRFLAIYPNLKHQAGELLDYYINQKQEQMDQTAKELEEETMNQRPVDKKTRVHKKKIFKPRGPVGLLVAAMALNNLTLASGFQVIAKDEPPFNTMEVPWQMVKPLLFEFTARARQLVVQANRTVMKSVSEVDHFLLRKYLRRLVGEEEAI